MIKAEDLKRHPEDDRVVVIDNMDDFNLWERRFELGFKGIILHDAMPEEELKFISDDISRIFKASRLSSFVKHNKFYSPDSTLEPDLKKIGYSDLTVDRVLQCSQLLKDINSGMSDSIFLRTNCDWPKKPHTHGTTLGMVFSGAGTVMVKEHFKFTALEEKDTKAIGSRPTAEDVYSLSVNDLIVFEDIWHYAPPLKEDDTEPRTNLII